MKPFSVVLSVLALVGFIGASPLLAAPLDINAANAGAIAKTMIGIGPKKAEAIVAYREQHGPFTSIDDLAKVPGLNVKLVDDNRSMITVGAMGTANNPVVSPNQTK